MQGDVTVGVSSDLDIVTARRLGRILAAELGFSGTDQVVIATAISELARHIIEHARKGVVTLSPITTLKPPRTGIQIEACDRGPSPRGMGMALMNTYSGSTDPGGHLGTRRLMDEFEVSSEAGKEATITIRKWTGEAKVWRPAFEMDREPRTGQTDRS